MLCEGVGVGPVREEQGVRGLCGDNGGFQVSCHQGAKEKVIGEGKDMFVVMGAIVMIGAMGEGIGAIRRTWFMDQADIVVA